MRFLRPVLLAAAAAMLTVARAAAPSASVTDIAAMAQVGADAASGGTNTAAKAAAQESLMAAWRDVDGAQGAIPLEKMSFPMASYPDGTVRVQFHAEHALLPQDEKAYVRGQGVQMDMFSPGGAFMGFFQADNCIYDRATRTGYCEGRVRVQYRNIKITGTNMVWDLESRNVKILSGARVTVSRFMKELGSVFKK